MDTLFFDLETTGPDSSKDRIVELGIKVISEDGTVIMNKAKLYNPEMKISQEATNIHNITYAMVKDQPTFKQDAKKLAKLFKDKIIAGYNIMVFDMPILLNEFDRAGVEVEFSGKYIDCFKIEQKLSSKSLSTVYKNYTGKDLEGAHGAEADLNATHEVMLHQIEKIKTLPTPLNEDINENLYELSGTKDIVDFYGKFKRDEEGYLVYKFGKHKDVRVVDEMGYAEWMLKCTPPFPSQVRNLIKEEQAKLTQNAFKRTTPKNEVNKGFGGTKKAPPKPANNGFMNTPPVQGKQTWQPVYNPEQQTAIDDLPF